MDVLGQSADGNAIHAVLGNAPHRFQAHTAGNFQCTLNVGSNRTTLWTDTKSVSGDPGDLLSVNWSTAETQVISALNSPASLVCRLPPKGSIVAYAVHENGHTDDGVYP